MPATNTCLMAGSCDAYGYRSITRNEQLEIAELAFSYWLNRGFRGGSPQEDWLKAQQQVQASSAKRRIIAVPKRARTLAFAVPQRGSAA